MARRRILSPDEKRLWDHVTRHVTPLHTVMTPILKNQPQPIITDETSEKPASSATIRPGKAPGNRSDVDAIAHFTGKLRKLADTGVGAMRGLPLNPSPVKIAKPEDKAHSPGIDAKQAKRFRRGELPIDARLDLHGMTEAVAHKQLVGFLAMARQRGLRCVLVITGKGDRFGKTGILRKRFQSWLQTKALNQHILLTSPAQPRHGGDGAQYVLLRKSRRS